ncbi:MAG: phospho-N-acetylmuramoyl-pentapeptide-transferase [Treponemataceae bacterium]
MFYYLGSLLAEVFGPARLFQSYTVLIASSLLFGFIVTVCLLPKFYKILPSDRGREFSLKENAEAAKGKPTGAGVVFITIFVLTVILFIPVDLEQGAILILTWLCMLTGYLDDRAEKDWGEYRKALLDLIICLAASFSLYFLNGRVLAGEAVQFWMPFVSKPINVAPWIFISVSTILLWTSINTTNCTDGVDGLSSTLVLIGLLTMGIVFYFVLGHKDFSAYLLVPHLKDGAAWGLMAFSLSGVLMGYLWHNAFPSHVLMGDAGSRALGFFTGVCIMVSGNPFLIFVTTSIILVNGGMGLLKVALKRFCKITIFANIRFPLHDHFRKTRNWSPTQVLIKFMILQTLITMALLGIVLKIR